MAIMRRRKTKISATRDRPAVARVEVEGEGMVEKVSGRENAMQEGVIVPPLPSHRLHGADARKGVLLREIAMKNS